MKDKVITVYICPKCNKEYGEKKRAQKCLDGHEGDTGND